MKSIINQEFEKKLVELVSEYYRIPIDIIYHLSPYLSEEGNYIKIKFPGKSKARKRDENMRTFFTDEKGNTVEKFPDS
jgi:hypothetical protein